MPNTQNSRIIIKRSTTPSEVPTVAPSNDHTDGSWIATDIYKGEIFVNLPDSKIYTRVDSGIEEIAKISDVAGISGLYKDTGVFTFAGLTFNTATTVNIGAVTGQIVDNESNPASPTITNVTYAGATNVSVTTVVSGLASYVMLDSAGVISFQNTFPTNAERKTKIYLGKLGHPMGTINASAIGNEPDYVLSPIAQIRALYKAIGFINNGITATANGANLNFNISAGTVVHYASNFVIDDTTPNEIAVAAGTPQSFLYRTQTGVGGGFVTAIDPANYDVAGTVTAIGGSSNQATNQYIYCIPGLGFIVQRGQTIYSTLALAVAAVGRESFTVYPNLINNSILIGILSVTKGATDLSNTSQAQFFTCDKFGQTTGSAAGSNGITALTGDVTATGPGSSPATIAANAVTYTKTYNGTQLAIVTAMKILSGN